MRVCAVFRGTLRNDYPPVSSNCPVTDISVELSCSFVTRRLHRFLLSLAEIPGEPTRHADSPPPHSRALNLPPTNLPPTHHRPRARTMAAPPPPPASPLNTLTPIVPRNPRIPRRGPSQHKGEPENHAQALEASPSRALTRPTKPTARLGHTIHPHPAPVAALAVAVGASQRQTVAVGPSRPTGPLGPSLGG